MLDNNGLLMTSEQQMELDLNPWSKYQQLIQLDASKRLNAFNAILKT